MVVSMPLGVGQCVDKAAIGNAGIRGMELLTDKHSLARVSRLLGWEGRFVPETATERSVGHEMSLEWLAKRGTHRGVYPLGAAGRERSPAEQPPAELLVQRRVAPPFLIDDRAWDLGVYAVLERRPDGSVGATLFDDVLLRFCTTPYLHTAAAQVCAAQPAWFGCSSSASACASASASASASAPTSRASQLKQPHPPFSTGRAGRRCRQWHRARSCGGGGAAAAGVGGGRRVP